MVLKIKRWEPEMLRSSRHGVNIEEFFELVGDRRVLSTLELDRMLLGSDDWIRFKSAFPCGSGTIAGYEAPGKALGEQIMFEINCLVRGPSGFFENKHFKWVFPVPRQFQGEVNAAISINHPHFRVEKIGNTRVIRVNDETNIMLTKNFPIKDGKCAMDPNTGIPTNDMVNSAGMSNVRELQRFPGANICQIIRFPCFDCGVAYLGGPDLRTRILMEMSDAIDMYFPSIGALIEGDKAKVTDLPERSTCEQQKNSSQTFTELRLK